VELIILIRKHLRREERECQSTSKNKKGLMTEKNNKYGMLEEDQTLSGFS